MAQQHHQQARRSSTALQWVGSFESGSRANEILQAASEQFHLVSPASSVGSLPEGCEIATAFVQVDRANETYDVGAGKRGLAKVALDRIAAAAGVSWDPVASCRLDDGSDPYYCLFRAVGTMRGFDGTPVTITGTKEMDLRPQSPQVVALEERARAKHKSADLQIREMRLHVLAHAESKARLRAIRSVGIRTSYSDADLEKPFLVARLVFTGRTQDPTLEREFALMRAQAMLGSVTALYGAAPAPQLVAAPPVQRMSSGVRPPPVGRSVDLDEEDIPEPRRSPPPPPQRGSHAAPAAPPSGGGGPKRGGGSGSGSDFVVPFGKSKGLTLDLVDAADLEWLAGAFRRLADDPEKARFRAKNLEALEAVQAEIAYRAAGGEGNEREPGDDL